MIQFAQMNPLVDQMDRRVVFEQRYDSEQQRQQEIDRNRQISEQDRSRADAADAALRRYATGDMGGPAAAPAPVPAPAPSGVASATMQPMTASGGGQAPAPASPAPASARGPVPDYIANTPGMGKFAVGLKQGAAAAEEEAERAYITAIAEGDAVTEAYYAPRVNVQIPEPVRADARQRQLWARGLAAAESMYKDDPAQAQSFVMTFMQNGGNLQDAVTKTGVPRSKPDWSLEKVYVNGQETLMRIDRKSGNMQAVTGPDGQPVQTQGPDWNQIEYNEGGKPAYGVYDQNNPGAGVTPLQVGGPDGLEFARPTDANRGGAGGTPAKVAEIEFLMAPPEQGGLGLTREQALNYAYQAKANPAAIKAQLARSLYESAMRQYGDMNPAPAGASDAAWAEAQRRANEFVDSMAQAGGDPNDPLGLMSDPNDPLGILQ